MNKQVITIEPGGIMSGLQRKPGQGLDLRQFGKADIQRASLIEWDADKQAWYIDVLQEAGRGKVTSRDLGRAGVCLARGFGFAGDVTVHPDGNVENPVLFAEYDDAVKVEIAYLDALRLRGQY